jgi:hypothetical protein
MLIPNLSLVPGKIKRKNPEYSGFLSVPGAGIEPARAKPTGF